MNDWLSYVDLLLCSSTFVRSIDGGWGTPLENGSFNGMIGMLQRGEVDCAVSGFGLFKKRAAVAAHLNPITHWRTRVFTNYAGWTSDGSTTFIVPFTKFLFICIGATFVICSAGLFATTYLGRGIHEDHAFSFGLDAMIILHGMMLQGAPYEPQKYSSRFSKKIRSREHMLSNYI